MYIYIYIYIFAGPHRETPPPAIIFDQFDLDRLHVNNLLNNYIQHRAYALHFELTKVVKSDFWEWGLSVWPPAFLLPDSLLNCRSPSASSRASTNLSSASIAFTATVTASVLSYIHIYIYMYIYIHIYIYKERERERYMCIYIYIYI